MAEKNKILKEGWVDVPIPMLTKAIWNYKTEDAEKAKRLKNKIAERGSIINIVIRLLPDGLYEIVNGNHRLDAYKALNMQAVHAFNMGVISNALAKRVALETNDHDDFDSDPYKMSEILNEIKVNFDDWDMTIPDFDIKTISEIQDYSDKNKEIDVSEFSNTMTIKLSYVEDDYFRVRDALAEIAATPEQAVFKLLGLTENE